MRNAGTYVIMSHLYVYIYLNIIFSLQQDVRKSYGIPSHQLIQVSDPTLPGVMVNVHGNYVVYKESW